MPIQGYDYTDQQIKDWFAANNDPAKVAEGAASLGFNAQQIQQAMQIGGYNVGKNEIYDYAKGRGYDFNSGTGALQRAGLDSTNVDGRRSVWSTTQKRWYGPEDIKAFFSSNPSDEKIIQTMGELGIPYTQLSSALNATGQLYKDPNNPLSGVVNNDGKWTNSLMRLQNAIYNGDYGWGTPNDPTFAGRPLVRGSGHQMITNADGSHTNVPFGADAGINGVSSRQAAMALEGGYGGLRFGTDNPGNPNAGAGGAGNQSGSYIGGTMNGPGSWAGYWDFSNGRGWPVGQYAYGTNGPAPTYNTPTQARAYGSWPTAPAGSGVVSAGSSSSSSNRNPADSMYGDYSNGW